MSMLLLIVLGCSVIVRLNGLEATDHALAYLGAVDRTEQQVVLLFNGIMEIDQGLHRYESTRTPAARRAYITGSEAVRDHLGYVERFVEDNNLTEASRAVAHFAKAYRSLQSEVAPPILLNRVAARNHAELGRVDVLADVMQADLLTIHLDLAAAVEAQDAATHKRLLSNIMSVMFFLVVLAGIGLAIDFKRRKDQARTTLLLEERAAALERSNAALQDFAHVASHDLQEPLRMVSSYTQLLARRYKGKLDADADEFIGFAVDGAKRMQVLIENVLSYSRISSAGHDTVAVDSNLAYDDALANLGGLISDTGAQVTKVSLPRVLGDQGQLAQLFQNLIGNALKYRSEKTPEIEISAARERSLWTFTVRDNGIGIAEEYRERVFRMFQRLHAKNEYSGTGIGLAVCRRIVERHGGTIWIDAPLGGGTAFHFTMQAA